MSRWVGLAGGDHECGEWAGQGVSRWVGLAGGDHECGEWMGAGCN